MKINLSLVMPCYNVKNEVENNLMSTIAVLEDIEPNYEIICVNDGSSDNTGQILKKFSDKKRKISLISYKKNMGKGYALRKGFKSAKGKIVGFIDADGDIDPKSLNSLLRTFKKNDADVVVGSKNNLGSKVKTPKYRNLISKTSQFIVNMLFRFNLSDTQAGIKLFKGKMIKIILPFLKSRGFSIDVEIISLAQKFGYARFFEAPIIVRMNGNKKMKADETFRFMKEIIETFMQFLFLRIRLFVIKF